MNFLGLSMKKWSTWKCFDSAERRQLYIYGHAQPEPWSVWRCNYC